MASLPPGDPGDEIEKLKTALRWLESHHKRLSIEREFLVARLDKLTGEVDRLSAEIHRARERLGKLASG